MRLRIPGRPEITKADKAEFLSILDEWDKSDFVQKETKSYYDWMDKQW